MALIDKEIIRAEIERRVDEWEALLEKNNAVSPSIVKELICEDKNILAVLNTLPEQPVEGLEEAVDGRYMKANGKVYVESWPLDIDPDSVKAGDEVRLIVIPEEK